MSCQNGPVMKMKHTANAATIAMIFADWMSCIVDLRHIGWILVCRKEQADVIFVMDDGCSRLKQIVKSVATEAAQFAGYILRREQNAIQSSRQPFFPSRRGPNTWQTSRMVLAAAGSALENLLYAGRLSPPSLFVKSCKTWRTSLVSRMW